MAEDIRKEADRRFEEARQEAGARDPRDFYRKALRELKEANPQGYETAVHHFQEILTPSIASGEAEPLGAWREYGRLIAELMGPGRTVAVDRSGLSEPYTPEAPMDHLVIHLQDAKGTKGLLISLPPDPSRAQLATYHLLVQGKQRLPS